jgi:hypothetical protein
MKVFLTDLAAYNNGELVGKWLELPMSEDELQNSIKEVLKDGEEYFITDYECDYMRVEEYSNIQELNEIAEQMSELDEDEIKIVNFLMTYGYAGNLDEALENIENVRIYEDMTMEDIAEQYIEECYNLDDMPSIIANNIDYKSIAVDMEIEGNYQKIDSDIYEYIG